MDGLLFVALLLHPSFAGTDLGLGVRLTNRPEVSSSVPADAWIEDSGGVLIVDDSGNNIVLTE